jgi:hypothetical protein
MCQHVILAAAEDASAGRPCRRLHLAVGPLIERRPLGKVGVSCHASLSRRCRSEIQDNLKPHQRDAVLHRRRRRSTFQQFYCNHAHATPLPCNPVGQSAAALTFPWLCFAGGGGVAEARRERGVPVDRQAGCNLVRIFGIQ